MKRRSVGIQTREQKTRVQAAAAVLPQSLMPEKEL